MTLRDVRSYAITAPLILLSTVFFGTLSLLASFTDATGRRQHRVARAWARSLLTIGGVKVVVEGLEKIDPKRGYVLVSNHTSYYDTPVILASIPLEFRFFAKHELFRIPLLGTHLERAGHLPVVRDDPRASLKTMTEGAKLIRQRNISVLLFPEGGRSEHTLREFKEGAAYVAIKAGVPAVPVGIVGARAVLKMHTKKVRPGTVTLRIADPIETSGMTVKDRERLNQQLVETIAGLVGEPVPVSAP